MTSKYTKEKLIYKKYHHIVCALSIESNGIGVHLRRPYRFSVSGGDSTFLFFESFKKKKDPFKSCIWEINRYLREEARIDPSQARKTLN